MDLLPAGPAIPNLHPDDSVTPVDRKSVRTRSAIIDAALKLFQERGYDATTMRAIALEAGVSVGNAYYYFESKEHLIQGFYDRAQVAHASASRATLDGERDLASRITGVLEAWIATMEPYRPFAGKFFKNAAEPTSPLSPFSNESSRARAAALDLWREVLEGSDAKTPGRLRADLPELLWLYHMGVVLFWVYDPTPGAAASRRVVARTVPVVVQAIGIARLPVMRNVLDDVVGLMDDVRLVLTGTEGARR